MTIQELIVLIDGMYPNAESDTIKVGYMNMAQNELSMYFGLVAEDTTLNTIAHDDSYALPTNISDISQIETLDVYNSAPDLDKIVASANMKVGTYTIADQPELPCRISVTHTKVSTVDTLGTITIAGTVDGTATTEVITPVEDSTVYGDKYFDIDGITSITGAGWVTGSTADTITVGVSQDRYAFTRYTLGFIDDPHYTGNIFYQVYTSAGVKSLVIYPTPTVADRNIRIRYRRALTELSATTLTASPDFDSRFHDMLAIYAAHMICTTGSSPDTVQANAFMQKYDSRLTELWKFSMEKDKVSLKKRKGNKWH